MTKQEQTQAATAQAEREQAEAERALAEAMSDNRRAGDPKWVCEGVETTLQMSWWSGQITERVCALAIRGARAHYGV